MVTRIMIQVDTLDDQGRAVGPTATEEVRVRSMPRSEESKMVLAQAAARLLAGQIEASGARVEMGRPKRPGN